MGENSCSKWNVPPLRPYFDRLTAPCAEEMRERLWPMPIRPQFRWFYPIDWRELSSVIRFERAQSRCERCRRPHGQVVCHLGDGRWWDEAEGTWRSGRGRKLRRLPAPHLISSRQRQTRVALATAHLDHDPTN